MEVLPEADEESRDCGVVLISKDNNNNSEEIGKTTLLVVDSILSSTDDDATVIGKTTLEVDSILSSTDDETVITVEYPLNKIVKRSVSDLVSYERITVEDPSKTCETVADVPKSEKNIQITGEDDTSKTFPESLKLSCETVADVAISEKNSQDASHKIAESSKKYVVASSEFNEPKWPPILLEEMQEAATRMSHRKAEREEILGQRNETVLGIHQSMRGD